MLENFALIKENKIPIFMGIVKAPINKITHSKIPEIYLV